VNDVVYLVAVVVVAGAGVLGGISGFGYSLISTPLMLALGFPLALIVPFNLAIALTTRIVVAYQLRSFVRVRRVALIAGASVPGILIGLWINGVTDPTAVKIVTGVIVMIATALIWYAGRRPPPAEAAYSAPLAGLLAGVLGATTSLNGVPPVLLLAREKAEPRLFQADLALFFVLSNLATLALKAGQGSLPGIESAGLAVLWIAVAMVGNQVGVRLGTRLPTAVFRNLALALAFSAGAMTVLTA
jgi:uncharacterized membrane protein YfcA